MTADEIQELFIQAAEIDRRLPIMVRPSGAKSMSLPYIHDWADINGWDSEDKHAREWAWLDPMQQKIRPEQVTLWERANSLIRVVENEGHRRALLNWAIAKAGGRPFAQWCRRDEGIHEETGRRRKDRALHGILLHQSRLSGVSTHASAFEGLLPSGPEISHKSVSIGQSRSWIAEGSKPLRCDIDFDLEEFDWAAEQNARRRQREAKKRQQPA